MRLGLAGCNTDFFPFTFCLDIKKIQMSDFLNMSVNVSE